MPAVSPSLRPAAPPRLRPLRTIGALMLREMAATHGRSMLGYLWAVAEPVAGILLLTFIFSLAFHAPPLGTSFAFFYASGYLPFVAYLEVSQKVSQSIRFSRPLLFYPGVTFLDAILARFLLAAMTQAMVAGVVLVAMVPLLGIRTLIDIPAVAGAMALAMVLALGMGVLNCFLTEMVPAWERVWAILNRPLFVISGVFFLFEAVPEPWRGWLWFNPLVHAIGQMRVGLYPTYDGAGVSPAYVLALAGGLMLAGLVLLGRYHRDLING